MSSGDTAQAAEALRGNFASYLKGPSVEVIPLSARLASQATGSTQSECDYVLYLSLSVKKGGGSMFGRAIGNIAGSAAGHIPLANLQRRQQHVRQRLAASTRPRRLSVQSKRRTT